MVARLQVIDADEGSLQGELGGEHLHADIYLIVFPGVWSLDGWGWSGRLLFMCTDYQKV